MDFVSMFFEWGDWIFGYFSKAAEWFCTPFPLFDEILHFGLIEPFLNLLKGLGFNLFVLAEMSPIEFLLGPGLLFFLGAVFVKWLLGFVPSF